MATYVLSDKLVRSVVVGFSSAGATWTEGDKFAIKDVDGDAPTGEHTVKAIRVKVVKNTGVLDNGQPWESTVRRIYLMDEYGRWVRDLNCVPFVPKHSARLEAIEHATTLLDTVGARAFGEGDTSVQDALLHILSVLEECECDGN